MDNVFVDGLPIPKRIKWILVLVMFGLLVINHNLPVLSSVLNYEYRDIVSLIILGLFVLFSIGSITAESMVIGLSVFVIMSNLWDFSVVDISELRQQILIGSIVVLFAALSFGKVSFFNLIQIIRAQLGVSK